MGWRSVDMGLVTEHVAGVGQTSSFLNLAELRDVLHAGRRFQMHQAAGIAKILPPLSPPGDKLNVRALELQNSPPSLWISALGRGSQQGCKSIKPWRCQAAVSQAHGGRAVFTQLGFSSAPRAVR
ncbi:hypothetical protein Anapl_02072 [Anas platyrhynchos]|uniref:Uncharacterized protein n=1 Tax=Anas platyrhynchos TaxID=8839 RepID=R0K657_ANAPL|nr:hypothetical protein Anapl_02072 [Anas platyrhynchos]